MLERLIRFLFNNHCNKKLVTELTLVIVAELSSNGLILSVLNSLGNVTS